MRRPNILFAFADDWGRYASAYRRIDGDGTPNVVIETPTFDRIADEGVLFTNAFVPAPSCTPCRSSNSTGFDNPATNGADGRYRRSRCSWCARASRRGVRSSPSMTAP